MKDINPDGNLENEKITEELNSVNEARIHAKDIPEDESNEDDELSPEQLLKTELDEANNKYLRLYAEFDNYKRRTSKERIDLLQSAGKDVISDLLPIIDDFERALKSMEQTENLESIKEGIILVSQ